MNRQRFSVAIVLAAFLAVNGCGGGGSDPVFGPGPNELFGGLWFGTFTTTGTASVDEVAGISTDDGEFQFLFVDLLIQVSGLAVVNGTEVTGDGFAFAPPGEFFPGGDTVTPFSFNGTLTSRTSLSGEWEIAADNTTGTFELEYDDQDHPTGAAISRVAKNWIQYDDLLNPIVSFSINDNLDGTGLISGTSALCASIGTISIPDTAFNVYEWNTTVSGVACPIVGSYAGLATLGENNAPDDLLIVLANDTAMPPVRALFIPLEL